MRGSVVRTLLISLVAGIVLVAVLASFGVSPFSGSVDRILEEVVVPQLQDVNAGLASPTVAGQAVNNGEQATIVPLTDTPGPTATLVPSETPTATAAAVDWNLETIPDANKTDIGVWLDAVALLLTDPANSSKPGYFPQASLTFYGEGTVRPYLGDENYRYDEANEDQYYLYAIVDGQQVYASPQFCEVCTAQLLVADYASFETYLDLGADGLTYEALILLKFELEPFNRFGDPWKTTLIFPQFIGHDLYMVAEKEACYTSNPDDERPAVVIVASVPVADNDIWFDFIGQHSASDSDYERCD